MTEPKTLSETLEFIEEALPQCNAMATSISHAVVSAESDAACTDSEHALLEICRQQAMLTADALRSLRKLLREVS